MTTAETIRRSTPKPPTRSAAALTVAGALVAVVVAAVFIIALAGRHTSPTASHTQSTHEPYTPLIQYRGTGQAPVAAAAGRTAEVAATVGLLRAEHSYGAVP